MAMWNTVYFKLYCYYYYYVAIIYCIVFRRM